MQNEMLRATIRHEFGHLVVAKSLGFSTGRIEITQSVACAQIILRPTFADLLDVADYSRRRVQVLYAGAGAQALDATGIIDADIAERLLQTTSMNDHAKIRELLRIISAIECPDAVADDDRGQVTTKLDTELRGKTGALVEKRASLIFAMTEFCLAQTTKAGLPFTLLAKQIDSFPGVNEHRT
jgi:hypothetical protein